MTETEKNAISAGLLVFATATEMFMNKWLLATNSRLTGESKMLFNGMKHGVESAKHYYGRFTEKVASVVFDEDKDPARFDSLMQEAAFMARTYFTTLNLNNNDYPDESIEKALNDILAKEENPEIYVSKEVIDMFRVR